MSTPFSELEFISWLSARLTQTPAGGPGLGDDCAMVDWSGRGPILTTTDMLIEGSCFIISDLASLYDVGKKAMAVNFSDAAAMGAEPLTALVSLGVPESYTLEMIQNLYEGMIAMAEKFSVKIIGGDTNCLKGPLTVSVTVMASVGNRDKPVLRSGAMLGDSVYVTGPLGGSIHHKHLHFLPRVPEGRWLREFFSIHAMMDISDGLTLDLHRLCTASGVGCELNLDAIPIALDARRAFQNKSPLERALSDGEDFELLFTCSPEEGQRIEEQARDASFSNPLLLTKIGTVIPGSGGLFGFSKESGRVCLTPKGFVHGQS